MIEMVSCLERDGHPGFPRYAGADTCRPGGHAGGVMGRFVGDSPLEGGGFEPSVPLAEGEGRTAQPRKASSLARGTEGSNPAPSSAESVSAVNPSAVGDKPRTLAAVCAWLGT